MKFAKRLQRKHEGPGEVPTDAPETDTPEIEHPAVEDPAQL